MRRGKRLTRAALWLVAALTMAVVLAGPAAATTIDLNVDLLRVTEATLTPSPDPLGANWEQTSSSGGFFPTFALGATAPHTVSVSIPWSTNNETDFTVPLLPGAPVDFEFDTSLDPSSRDLLAFDIAANITLTFHQTGIPTNGGIGSL